jgi:hypothetical protein
MRELTADMFVSLDGFAAGADGGQSWTFGYFGPEFAAYRAADPGRAADHDHGAGHLRERLSSYSSGLDVKCQAPVAPPAASIAVLAGVKRQRCFTGAAMTAPVKHRCRYCRAGRGGSGFAGRAGGTHGTHGKAVASVPRPRGTSARPGRDQLPDSLEIMARSWPSSPGPPAWPISRADEQPARIRKGEHHSI